MSNKLQLTVTVVNPNALIVIEKNYPWSSEDERLAYGLKMAIKMFSTGVFNKESESKIRAIPPHRIKDILIVSI